VAPDQGKDEALVIEADAVLIAPGQMVEGARRRAGTLGHSDVELSAPPGQGAFLRHPPLLSVWDTTGGVPSPAEWLPAHGLSINLSTG
jgi:hypothetical protein